MNLRDARPHVAVGEGDPLADDKRGLHVLRTALGREVDDDIVARDGANDLPLHHVKKSDTHRGVSRCQGERRSGACHEHMSEGTAPACRPRQRQR